MDAHPEDSSLRRMLSLHLLACVHWHPLAPTSLEAAVHYKQNTPVVFGHLLLSALSQPMASEFLSPDLSST